MPDQKSKARERIAGEMLHAHVGKLSFKDARRARGPIYQVLLQELHEQCCPKTAKYFECLVKKEDLLIKQRVIKDRVRDDTDFLIKLVENFILAEQSFKLGQSGGNLAGIKIIYQNMLLLETRLVKYNWLAAEIYDIAVQNITPYMENKTSFEEIQMRINYKYGRFLYSKGNRLDLAIKSLDKSLELAKAELWAPDVTSERCFSTMAEMIADVLAKACLMQARNVLLHQPQEALKLATKAVCALSSVSSKNKSVLREGLLSKVVFMIKCEMDDYALRLARKVQPYFTKTQDRDSVRYQCQLFLYKGICFYNLNDLPNALESFQTSYAISHKYQLADLKGKVLLNIGRTYSRDPNEINCALQFYRAAKAIFAGLNDYQNKMKTTYFIARLQVEIVFPEFLLMLKSPHYCDYYNLRQWKNQCRPFWKGRISVDRDQQLSAATLNHPLKRRKLDQKARSFKDADLSKISFPSKASFASKSSTYTYNAVATEHSLENLDCLLNETWDDK